MKKKGGGKKKKKSTVGSKKKAEEKPALVPLPAPEKYKVKLRLIVVPDGGSAQGTRNFDFLKEPPASHAGTPSTTAAAPGSPRDLTLELNDDDSWFSCAQELSKRWYTIVSDIELFLSLEEALESEDPLDYSDTLDDVGLVGVQPSEGDPSEYTVFVRWNNLRFGYGFDFPETHPPGDLRSVRESRYKIPKDTRPNFRSPI